MGVSINRWEKAQKAEAASWKINSQPKQLTDKVRRKNLEHMSKYTSLSESELKNMRILEIGGAVVERTFDSVNIAPKLVLDPLFPFARLLGQQDKSCHRVRGIAEYLPLPDKSIDLCWCANVIDHTFQPQAVLGEIWRVLDKRGILIISCDVFPPWTKPLFPLFNTLDTPHPHHFTLAGFKTLLKQEFETQSEFEVDSSLRLSLRRDSRLSLARDLKNKMAAVIRVRPIFFYCIPIRR